LASLKNKFGCSGNQCQQAEAAQYVS
jgi:hypothetical protein